MTPKPQRHGSLRCLRTETWFRCLQPSNHNFQLKEQQTHRRADTAQLLARELQPPCGWIA